MSRVCKYFKECPAVITYWGRTYSSKVLDIEVPEECMTDYESCPIYRMMEQEEASELREIEDIDHLRGYRL